MRAHDEMHVERACNTCNNRKCDRHGAKAKELSYGAPLPLFTFTHHTVHDTPPAKPSKPINLRSPRSHFTLPYSTTH